jgi:hypothetical protein
MMIICRPKNPNHMDLFDLLQDSMGKDGTQLLRHCVRLLVLVSTDLLAVRLSGIFSDLHAT